MEMMFKIIYNFATFAILLNFLFINVLISKRKIEKKYKLLNIYLVGILIPLALMEFKRRLGLNEWNYIDTICLIQPLAHFLFLGLFILNEDVKKNKKSLIWGIITSIIFLFLFSIYIDQKIKEYYTVTLANIGLIIVSIIYFKKLLKSNPEIDLKKSPSFLIATGTFISSGISIPIYLFASHLKIDLDLHTYLLIVTIAPLATIILHSFITYSFKILWNTKK